MGALRGAMGNLVRLKPGQVGNGGLSAAHGVLYLLRPTDMAKLAHMEHEYMYGLTGLLVGLASI